MAQYKTETYTYTLPSAEIEIEGLSGKTAGASDVGWSDEVRKVTVDKLLTPLGEFSDLLFGQLTEKMHKPDSVTLEFGATIKGENKWFITLGGEANLKVSLTWNKPI